jgi:hypothetical protein
LFPIGFSAPSITPPNSLKHSLVFLGVLGVLAVQIFVWSVFSVIYIGDQGCLGIQDRAFEAALPEHAAPPLRAGAVVPAGEWMLKIMHKTADVAEPFR